MDFLFVLLAGLAIAAGVTRAIRVPLRKVRARLLYLSRGIDHRFPCRPAAMKSEKWPRHWIGWPTACTEPVNSALPGRGQFDTEYTPLSEEDVLGKTLLAMRDDLASYEREMEAKVAERTETLTRQTAQLESQGRRFASCTPT